jgi:hypothetical protein
VAAHHHGLRLTNVELAPSGSAERLDRLLEKGSGSGHIRCMKGGVICVLMATRGWPAPWEQDAAEARRPLKLATPCCQGLRCYDIQQRAEGAPLSTPGVNGNGPAQLPPIKHELRLGPLQQELHPADAACREAHALHAELNPRSVEAIIRLGEVQEQDNTWLLHLLQVINLLQVTEDIVSYLPARHKGGLGRVYHRL